MIPQILLTAILCLLLGNAYRDRLRHSTYLKQFQVTLGFVILIFILLYWGDFYAPITKLLP